MTFTPRLVAWWCALSVAAGVLWVLTRVVVEHEPPWVKRQRRQRRALREVEPLTPVIPEPRDQRRGYP